MPVTRVGEGGVGGGDHAAASTVDVTAKRGGDQQGARRVELPGWFVEDEQS